MFLLLGCKGRPGPSPAPSAAPPPPPAPAGLVADLVVSSPRVLYGALRSLVVSRAPLLAASPELMLASVLGLPPQAAGALLLDRPLVGAAVLREGGASLSFVGACRVKSGAELAQVLAARTPLPGAPALGVVDDWLVVADEPKALSVVGPYVVRTLGARPPPAEALTVEVREAALRGAASASLRAQWTQSRSALSALAAQARSSEGRPADFGDPAAILLAADERVATLLGVLESSQRLRLALTLAEGALGLGLELEPLPGGPAEKVTLALPTGDFAPLLALPRDTVAGVLFRTDEAELDALATETDAGANSPFWASLPAREVTPLKSAIAEAAKSFGTSSAFGLLRDRTFVLTSSLRDPGAFERASPALIRALRLPAVREPLGALLGKVEPSESQSELVGLDSPLHKLTIVPRRAAAKGSEWWWGIRASTLLVAGAPEPSTTFGRLVEGAPAHTLAADATVAAMARRRVPSALAVYAELSMLEPAAGPAPMLFAWGRRERTLRVELELSNAAASRLLARFGS